MKAVISRGVRFGAGIAFLIALLLSWQANAPASVAGGPVILVDTNEDLAMGNGNCSISEAISAANLGALVDNCDGEVSDTIAFDLGPGTPQIAINTQLPDITAPVAIEGHTGGATRVELRGAASFLNGLNIVSTGAGTSIQDLVINNFETGIDVGADDVAIQGNYIGTDADGTVDEGNSQGIFVSGMGTQIGGTAGVHPGGSCSGDCNLISGNFTGIYVSSGADTVIQGNFIGTTASGEDALGNDTGIHNQGPGTLIGGDSAAAGNLISGNDGVGTDTFFYPSTIKGNLIGTDTDGTTAIPNVIGIVLGDHAGTEVGGMGAARNVISGNETDGLLIRYSVSMTQIVGNLVGTAGDGTSPLGNGVHGINIFGPGNFIGTGDAGDLNAIAFNGGDGVHVEGNVALSNAIQGNSIHDNAGKGIENTDGGNSEFAPPVITGTGSVFGTSCPNCEIDVFSDSEDEGRIFEGKVAADVNGDWFFAGLASGPVITATATDPTNNTSEFSEPFELPATPTPSPSPTSPATASPTPSPTAPVIHLQGDLDCDGLIAGRDGLFPMLFKLGLPILSRQAGCPGMTAGSTDFADVTCSGAIDELDMLAIVAFAAGVKPQPQSPPCVAIGEALG